MNSWCLKMLGRLNYTWNYFFQKKQLDCQSLRFCLRLLWCWWNLWSISWKTNSLLASSLEIVVGFRVFAGISQSDQKVALAFLHSPCSRVPHRSAKTGWVNESCWEESRGSTFGASMEMVWELCYWQRRGNERRCAGCRNHNGSYIVGRNVKPSFSSDLRKLACVT